VAAPERYIKSYLDAGESPRQATSDCQMVHAIFAVPQVNRLLQSLNIFVAMGGISLFFIRIYFFMFLIKFYYNYHFNHLIFRICQNSLNIKMKLILIYFWRKENLTKYW
jgi:hypothetical protein